MTEQEFAAKVIWEGGIFDALEYGLKSADCDPGKLRDLWTRLEYHWIDVEPLAEEIEKRIEVLTDE
jgi:hypothetical protein